MLFLGLTALVLLCWFSVCVRLVLLHPIKTVYNAVIDLYKYIRYAGWRVCSTGKIRAYVGLFGRGKTLSAVHAVVRIYRRYNDKQVYVFSRKKWVTQKVHIISNVELLTVPYEKFVGLSQIVTLADTVHKKDLENDTLTVTIVLGDEFSVQLNSRSFKSNIDPLFLNTLLTCRHHHISLIYTAQRFSHVDALLRQVTSDVLTCNKVWRFQVHGQYDAFALENATDPTLVKPLHRFGWFVEDKDYHAYDTLACVGNLAKSCKEGDMLSEEEILSLQQNNGIQLEGVTRPSRKIVKSLKKRSK